MSKPADGGDLYAGISMALSVVSLACFVLYGRLHAAFITPEAQRLEGLVGAVGSAQIPLALGALVCCAIALRRHAWRNGAIALALAALAGWTSLIVF